MKDHISEIHNYSMCLETRTIWFFNDVDSESSKEFIKNLHILDNYKSGTITVILRTEGGEVSAGLDMVDAIRLLKNPSRAICYGGVESMGTVILQAFRERCMTPNSYLMVHEGNAGVEGKGKDREEWNRLLDHQENACLSEYLEKINNRQREKKKKKLSKKELEEMLQFDKILLPKEAISLGLADRIIEEPY